MSDTVSPIRPNGGNMSEFELLAQDLLEKAEAEEQLRQENDKKLLGQVLEIYDQKYVAELLRKVGKMSGVARLLIAGLMVSAHLRR